MSFSRAGDSLSKRLQALRKAYTNQKHIWDIGCDHGNLGLSFLDANVKSINLVDASLPVVEELKKKIKDSYISDMDIKIIHNDGQKLKIPETSNCIFIAGMGGKEIFQILTHLLPQLDASSVVCVSPHRWIRELRLELSKMPVALVHEEVVLDFDRFYEIIVIIPSEIGSKVKPFGDQMWSTNTGKQYLDHQLNALKDHKDRASLQYVEFMKTLKS